MNKEVELENYLVVSPKKFGIYLFDKYEFKNLYEEELVSNEKINSINFNNLKKFLDKNIFKIEKLSGKFVENIFIIFDDYKIFNLQIGIKKKNYNFKIKSEYLENYLYEAKDLFTENYQAEKIMHMIVNKYMIDGKSYTSLQNNIECQEVGLEIQFKSISHNIIYELNKVLENYQIKISKFIDGSYVKNFINEDTKLIEMAHKISNGYNQNEVIFVSKNPKKLNFFEKFFQLFS